MSLDIDDMLAFAYSECGLSVDAFFELSNYEWSLEVFKIRQRVKKEHAIWESQAVLSRELMATIVNVAPRGKNARTYTGKDFIKLSFDIPIKKVDRKPMTDKDMKQKFGTKFLKNG